MRLGVHVPIAGGFLKALAWAERLSCTTMQLFSRSPRGGPAPPLTPAVTEPFDRRRRQADIAPLAVHAPYVMNLASPEPGVFHRSVALLQEEYGRATRLEADYVVIHLGSHKGEGEAGGIGRVASALNQTLDEAECPVMILLENTAGAGEAVGSRFESLAAIRQAVTAKERVGCCLDTAHLFAAGFPIHTAEGLAETLGRFDRIVGLEHLKLVHLNDSKAPFDSRLDRHWHIGEGHIGLEGMRRLVTHPRLAQVPFILETPKQHEREDRRNLATVRRLVGSRGHTRRSRAVSV